MKLTAATARELMTPNPVSISAAAYADEAAALLTDRAVGSVVAIDAAGHPVGVVTKTDLLVNKRENTTGTAAAVRDIMTPAVFSVTADSTAKAVVEQMLALNVHHLFVVDAGGVLVGVISPMDVLRKLG